MPGSMLHLLCAHQVCPNPSVLFSVGNIAPDAVPGWRDKDHTHFRDLPDRAPALRALAERTNGQNDFAEGVLLHLYLDWKWDMLMLEPYKQAAGGDWLQPYRSELSLAGAYAFHHTAWSRSVWAQMDAIPAEQYGQVEGASPAQVKEFISRNHRWHLNNDVGPSAAFPPERIEQVIRQAAGEYWEWIHTCRLK